ncbi:hypothetical protein OG21DRAFT_1484329 [Imleria badia]|nr:hypothetical protein OG21DRAFT_1484329 [Imleria badia]
MENRRTPDEDLTFSSNVNTTGAPRTTQSSVSNLHQSCAAFPFTSHSSTTSLPRHPSSRHPSYSTLSHSHFTQQRPHPSSSDHSLQPLAASSYPPPTSTSAPTTAYRPLSGPSSSNPSMIVSALSFYDPAHASDVPDYHQLSRWDVPFDPSLPGAVDNALVPRDSTFLSGSASTGGDDFQLIHSVTGFGFRRANAPSDGSQLHPQQPTLSQQQRRQIVPIPRRQTAPRHHDPTETQVQVQAERREQRKAENQTREGYPASQELANQRLQELLSLNPSSSYTPPPQSQSQSHRLQSRELETAFPTSQDQPIISDAHSALVEYQIQGTSFSSASDLVTAQNAPYLHRPTEQYPLSSAGSEAAVGITVEHVNVPPGMYYNVQASHSLSSLHDAYPLASRPYPQTHTHSSPHSSFSGFTPPTHSNTPASDTGYGSYPSYPSHHLTSRISDSSSARANTSGVVYTGAGGHSALSPAGSYGSYRGTNTTSSLDEASGSGRASGASSGLIGSGSSQVSEMLSNTSRTMGMMESRGYGSQYPVEDESRSALPVQERREGVSGQGGGSDGHLHGQGRGHAHSTSSSTVTASPPHLRRGSSGVPMAGVFPRSDFGSGSAQPGYSAQPSHPHYGLARQQPQPHAQALAHMRASQGQYPEAISASHTTPASGIANPLGRSEFQAQTQRMAEPQGQARTAVPATHAPAVRTSTKRTRAPKRPRPAAAVGIGTGASRGNVVESDDDSDDDEIIEWVPGLDDGGGPGFGGGAGAGEPGGTGGGTAQAAPGLPGGRKCVTLLFLWSPMM